MSKTVVIHQPDFLPYLGFFHRFLHADLWVVLDHVQFLSGSKSWHNRDKIKTPKGPAWITVAVAKAPQQTPIKEIRLSDDPAWREKNLNLIHHNYRKAPGFVEVFPRLEELFHMPAARLVDFNMASIRMLMDMLDTPIDLVLSSDLGIEGSKTVMLVDICSKVKADAYLSGVGARDYLDVEYFSLGRIELLWQEFVHPVYPQIYGEFSPYLSSIDLLLQCGIERARAIMHDL